MGRIWPIGRPPLGRTACPSYSLPLGLDSSPSGSARHELCSPWCAGRGGGPAAPSLPVKRQPAEGTTRERVVQQSHFAATGGTELTGSGRRRRRAWWRCGYVVAVGWRGSLHKKVGGEVRIDGGEKKWEEVIMEGGMPAWGRKKWGWCSYSSGRRGATQGMSGAKWHSRGVVALLCMVIWHWRSATEEKGANNGPARLP
jgi:hypothetical protein